MKNGVFWIVTPCGSCKNRRIGGTWLLLHQGDKSMLVAACVVPSSPIFVTLMKEAPGSSETSVLTRATWRNNPEDTILHVLHRFAPLGCLLTYGLETVFSTEVIGMIHLHARLHDLNSSGSVAVAIRSKYKGTSSLWSLLSFHVSSKSIQRFSILNM
jgi:hypothetical protein